MNKLEKNRIQRERKKLLKDFNVDNYIYFYFKALIEYRIYENSLSIPKYIEVSDNIFYISNQYPENYEISVKLKKEYVDLDKHAQVFNKIELVVDIDHLLDIKINIKYLETDEFGLMNTKCMTVGFKFEDIIYQKKTLFNRQKYVFNKKRLQEIISSLDKTTKVMNILHVTYDSISKYMEE